MLSGCWAGAQTIPGVIPDSLRTSFPTLRSGLPDSLFLPPKQTPSSDINWDSIKISNDGVDAVVEYHSKDSMYFDIVNKQIHLYGEAQVKYQTMTINAEYIIIDWKENTMSAEGRKTPQGLLIGKPKFKESDQEFTASRMKYNFKTYKGIIYDASSQQEGLNVIGEKAKFFGNGGDTTKPNIIYNRNAIFSTCNLDHPHFGIRSNKQKVIPNKLAVVGPCNLVIGDVPTPVWLPFGFFPLKLGARSGLIFPQNYEYSESFGFGLERIGWYFPINDQLDLTLTGDIYLKGAFRVRGESRYLKRYKYSGNAALEFSYLRTEVEGQPKYNKAFRVNWGHNQDAKAHPYRSLGGNINVQTGDYQRKNNTDFNSVTQTSLSSNMSYRQRFDLPFDLSASFNHSQNTTSRDVTISFPTLNFQTQTLTPFKRKISGGKERWYERIQMRYTSEARNQFTAKDTTLFTQKTLDEAKYGIRHNVTAGTSFTLLKYFNFSPSANYKEVWYFNHIEKTFDPTPVVRDTFEINPENPLDTIFTTDTLKYGTLDTIEHFGLKPFRKYDMSISMSTKIFGTLLFKKGKLRGLRHVMTPSVSFVYSPDYTNPDWGYFKSVRTDLRTDEEVQYSIFENNRLSGFDLPSLSQKKQMALSYSLSNLFEAKVFSKKDSTEKKVNLLRSVNFGGSYNFAADTLQWSVVSGSTNASLFNGISNFRIGVNFDPYDRDPKTGRRINQLYIKTQGKPLRFVDFNMSLNTAITIGRLRDFIKGVNTDERTANEPPKEQEDKVKEEDFLSLFEDFSINHNISVVRQFKNGKDTVLISTNSLNTRGDIRLTKNWRISVGNIGYDFNSKRVTYPDFGFTRDLHCWEMGFFWQPQNGTYSFYLKVKPGQLDFINLPYRKNIQDRQAGF